MNLSSYLFQSNLKIVSEEMTTKTGLGNINVSFVIVPLLIIIIINFQFSSLLPMSGKRSTALHAVENSLCPLPC